MRPKMGKREMVISIILAIIIISAGVYFIFIRDAGSGSIDDDDQNDTNRRPVADAGLDQAVNPGEPAILNASGSYDDDNDPLYYKWDVDAGVDDDNDGIKDNDWVINGKVVEWTFPHTDEMITYIVTVNVSDGKKWSTDTAQVTIYLSDNKTVPEVTLSCNYQQEIPLISSRFIVSVEEVTSSELIFNFTYILENPDGDVIRNGTIVSMIPTAPNSTEITFIDTPVLGELDQRDSISFKESQEIEEGCYLTLWYMDERDPVGEVALSR